MTLAVLASLFLGLTVLVLRRDGMDGVRRGLLAAYHTLRTVGHLMLLGMMLSAMMRVVMPASAIGAWMGPTSGMVGLLIGTAVGVATSGGPYLALPLAASLLGAGAGAGPIAAYITAWSVIPLTRTMMYELPLLGGRYTAARLIVCLPFPILAGLLIPPLFDLFA